MIYVISATRALQDGVTPHELRVIAEWHDDQAIIAERKSKTRPADPARAARHRLYGKQLRGVAGTVEAERSMDTFVAPQPAVAEAVP